MSVSRETLRGSLACFRRRMSEGSVDGAVRLCAIRGSADLHHHLILSGVRFRTPPRRAADTGGISTTSGDLFRSMVYSIGRTPHSTALSRTQTSAGTADTSAPTTTPLPRTGPAGGSQFRGLAERGLAAARAPGSKTWDQAQSAGPTWSPLSVMFGTIEVVRSGFSLAHVSRETYRQDLFA
jgi:hypothetical protein